MCRFMMGEEAVADDIDGRACNASAEIYTQCGGRMLEGIAIKRHDPMAGAGNSAGNHHGYGEINNQVAEGEAMPS